MPSKIIILEPQVVNQIAAGEVVERPASVVKELIENAVDAGSTRIVIDVENHGLRLIRVTDNGVGMEADDALLAVQRHATSKIQTLNDLLELRSYGFRGEALPSIASVSRMEIITSTGSGPAFRLQLEGGKVVRTGSVGGTQGTIVTVEDLFFNTPARFKYLRSPSTEMARIIEVVQRLAVAHPEIAFQLKHDGNVLLATVGSGDLRETVLELFGKDLVRQLIPIDAVGPDRLTGLVGKPAVARANRNLQFLYVNGRPVRSLPMRDAAEGAYKNSLLAGRYPVLFLNLAMDPAQVDCNVHPAKLEVRFADESRVRGFIYRTIRDALLSADLIAEGTLVKKTVGNGLPGGEGVPRFFNDELPDGKPLGGETWQEPQSRHQTVFAGVKETATGLYTSDLWREGVGNFRLIGQFRKSYLLMEGPDGLYIIDQHAAHERVLFERLGKDPDLRASQELLFPLVLNLEPQEVALWHEHGDELEKAGFKVEPFGGNSLLVRAVPAMLQGLQDGQVIVLFLQYLDQAQGEAGEQVDAAVRRALAACKAAIKANEPLTNLEAEKLVADLLSAENPYTCPHGRPILVKLGVDELNSWFKRR